MLRMWRYYLQYRDMYMSLIPRLFSFTSSFLKTFDTVPVGTVFRFSCEVYSRIDMTIAPQLWLNVLVIYQYILYVVYNYTCIIVLRVIYEFNVNESGINS